MQPINFQSLVRRILKEEMEKTSAVGVKSQTRVPEMDANGVDPEKKHKTFETDANSRDASNKETLLADLIEFLGKKDDSVSITWDDHDDLMVNGRDLKYIRISPRWEDCYVIEMMTRNEDRVLITGMNWKQVKDFVKNNISGTTTAVEKAYDKSYRNREDQIPAPDKGLPQDDKPKTLPTTDKALPTEKKKDKSHTEKDVKKEADEPTKPMQTVDDFKKQSEHKVSDPVKLRKRKPDTKLTAKQ